MIDSTLNEKTNGVSIRSINVTVHSEKQGKDGMIYAIATAPGTY